MLKDPLLNKPDNQKWLKAIGLYQIIGGALGLAITSMALVGFSQPMLQVLFLPAIALYGFSIYAGQLALRLTDNCLKWTIINQLLQIFAVFAGQFGYQYISGLGLYITADFSADFRIGAEFDLSTFSFTIGSTGKFFFGINIIALVIIYKIENIKADIKTKLELQAGLKESFRQQATG